MVRELRALGNILIRWIVLALLGAFAAFFLPFPGRAKPFAADLFANIQENLLPKGVQLVTSSLLDAFLAQANIALFTGFALALPYLLFGLARYISPGLYERERRSVLTIALPSFLLFAAGCAFAYAFVVPSTFSILFSYASSLNVVPFFTVSSFISSVLSLILITGTLFLLPVCMALLSRFRLVPPFFWIQHWRIALLVLLIAAAILSPDGSGVGMAILSVPMVALYGAGIIISRSSHNTN